VTEPEQVLDGGNVSGPVVRIGGTVRKSAGPWTPAVDALLAHLHARGFTGAPRPLGRDEQGRLIREYVPGQLATDLPPLDIDGLHRVGRLIRELHDACDSPGPASTPKATATSGAPPPTTSTTISPHLHL
jgi:hypothetical protein